MSSGVDYALVLGASADGAAPLLARARRLLTRARIAIGALFLRRGRLALCAERRKNPACALEGPAPRQREAARCELIAASAHLRQYLDRPQRRRRAPQRCGVGTDDLQALMQQLAICLDEFVRPVPQCLERPRGRLVRVGPPPPPPPT